MCFCPLGHVFMDEGWTALDHQTYPVTNWYGLHSHSLWSFLIWTFSLSTCDETALFFSRRTLKPVFTIFVDPWCHRTILTTCIWPPHTTSEHHICIVENELPNQSCSSRWCGSHTLVPVVEAQLIVKNLICSWSVPWSSALPPPTKPRPAQQGGP